MADRPKFNSRPSGDRPYKQKPKSYDDREPRRDFRSGPPAREGRPYNDREPRRDYNSGPPREGRSYSDRGPRRDFKSGPPSRGDRPYEGRTYNDREPRRDFRFGPPSREGRPYNDREPRRDLRSGPPSREGRPYSDREPRREFKSGLPSGERRSYTDRPPRREDSDRSPREGRPYGDRPSNSKDAGGFRGPGVNKPGFDRKPYAPRRDFDRPRPAYNDRNTREDKPRFDRRPDRESYGSKPSGGFSDRPPRERSEFQRPAFDKAPAFAPDLGPSTSPIKRMQIDTRQARTPRGRWVWIFDNMIAALPDGTPEPGDTVGVYDFDRRFLGVGTFNPYSKIRARIFSLVERPFDAEYVMEAINIAVQFRQKRAQESGSDNYRAVFSESDGLPGVIVDKIGTIAVIQILTLAAHNHKDAILKGVRNSLEPTAVIIQQDSAVREKEGIAVLANEVIGEIPNPLFVQENGYWLATDLEDGQKTGLYLDQRENRNLIKPYCSGARVLDLFCHVGGWSFAAARFGASETLGIDSSPGALALATVGAERNEFDQCVFKKSDGFDYVTQAANEAPASWDVIICDPPAFAKRADQLENAIKGYHSLNYRAMQLLKPGGILVTCSCSYYIHDNEFEQMLAQAARNAGCHMQVLHHGGQPWDHAPLLGFPESHYLKCMMLRKVS